MIADTKTLDEILSQVKQLSPEYRLRLMERIIHTLVTPTNNEKSKPLQFGEFGGDEALMSTWEDFMIAEWQPTNEELDSP